MKYTNFNSFNCSPPLKLNDHNQTPLIYTYIYIELTTPWHFQTVAPLRYMYVCLSATIKISWTGMDKMLTFVISIVPLYDVLIFIQSTSVC